MMILDTTYLATLVGLFVILSPGLLLTIPPLSLDEITKKGVSYEDGSGGAAEACTSVTGTGVEAECKKAHDLFASGYTSQVAVLLHALVFAAALYFLPQNIGLRTFDNTSILVMAGLFAVLSPGLLLTLPSLSKTDCGVGKKNIADDGEFCDAIDTITEAAAPNCKKCTSVFASGHTGVVPVIVHGLVFGTVAYYVARNYL